MKHLQNTYGTSSCGQFCVAMISHIDLVDVIHMFGHNHGTKTEEVARVLTHLGYRCDVKRRVYHGWEPRYGILALTSPARRGWHWVVKWRDRYYDSLAPRSVRTLKEVLAAFPDPVKLSSFIEIYSGNDVR